jgi:hypothetical protein
MDRLTPPGAPPKIRAVIDRYLRLYLDANLTGHRPCGTPATRCAAW